MKNRYKVVILVCAIAVVCAICIKVYHTKQYLNIDFNQDEGQISLILSNGETISGWEKDGFTHFFIPAYVTSNIVKINNGYKFMVNGEKTNTIPFDELCEISFGDQEGCIVNTSSVFFHHSQNLYTMHINLENQEVENISKEERTKASIRIMTPDGKENYHGKEDEIGGHGNSTWKLEKKSYSLHLNRKQSLCNMNAGDKWLLLANYSEGTRMICKMLYDLSGKIGMEYYTHSEWLDLYINGEYYGNYLLCEKIEVSSERINIGNLDKKNKVLYQPQDDNLNGDNTLKGYVAKENPENITGGYVIEKDLSRYQVREKCGFYTDNGMCFSVTEPSSASIEEVTYIRDFIQNIEDLLEQNSSEVLQYIDASSFIRRFIIEEISFNYDSFITSCYFYKKINEDKLYADPVWDYDISFGEYNGPYLQYYFSILDEKEIRDNSDILDWDMKLHNNSDYMNIMKKEYADVYPILKQCLYKDINEYADKIRTSVILDNIRWENNEDGHYASFDNNVRYIKFFMRSRINMMNERYGINEVLEADDLTEEIHTIRCFYEGKLYEFQVKDGDFFKESDLPPYDNEKYSGWKYERDNLFFCELLPVFEDVILLPNERG